MKQIIKKIFKAIPYKKNLFRIIRFFWIPPYNIYKHLYFTGVMDVKTDSGSRFKMVHYGNEIENSIFWEGLTGWEKISMVYWMRLSRDAKVILDIGANTGVYALAAKAVNSTSIVYAFEPLKQMYRKLLQNATLNKYEINCVEKAVSDKNGKAIIYETGTDAVAAASLNADIRQYGNLNVETEIETITLDSFVKENKIDKVDLVKIDVETHEPSVIMGYMQHLFLHRPDFLIEVLTDEVGEKLQQVFDGHGYIYFNIDDKMGVMHKTDTIRKSDYFNFLIVAETTARKLNLI